MQTLHPPAISVNPLPPPPTWTVWSVAIEVVEGANVVIDATLSLAPQPKQAGDAVHHDSEESELKHGVMAWLNALPTHLNSAAGCG